MNGVPDNYSNRREARRKIFRGVEQALKDVELGGNYLDDELFEKLFDVPAWYFLTDRIFKRLGVKPAEWQLNLDYSVMSERRKSRNESRHGRKMEFINQPMCKNHLKKTLTNVFRTAQRPTHLFANMFERQWDPPMKCKTCGEIADWWIVVSTTGPIPGQPEDMPE